MSVTSCTRCVNPIGSISLARTALSAVTAVFGPPGRKSFAVEQSRRTPATSHDVTSPVSDPSALVRSSLSRPARGTRGVFLTPMRFTAFTGAERLPRFCAVPRASHLLCEFVRPGRAPLLLACSSLRVHILHTLRHSMRAPYFLLGADGSSSLIRPLPEFQRSRPDFVSRLRASRVRGRRPRCGQSHRAGRLRTESSSFSPDPALTTLAAPRYRHVRSCRRSLSPRPRVGDLPTISGSHIDRAR